MGQIGMHIKNILLTLTLALASASTFAQSYNPAYKVGEYRIVTANPNSPLIPCHPAKNDRALFPVSGAAGPVRHFYCSAPNVWTEEETVKVNAAMFTGDGKNTPLALASNLALTGSPTTTTQPPGTNNTTIATSAFVTAAVNQVAVPTGTIIDVIKAGAICNGAGDDKAALDGIVAGAPSGATLYLRRGANCVIAAGVLNINKRIHIQGEGIESSFSCRTGLGVDCIKYAPPSGNIDGLNLYGFSILGTGARNALTLTDVTRSKVDEVYVAVATPANGAAVKLEGVLINKFRFIVSPYIPYPYTYGNPSNGILMVGSALYPSNANSLDNCVVEGGLNTGYGLKVDGTVGVAGTTNNWVIGGTYEGDHYDGVYFKGANFFSIENLHIEDVVPPGFTGERLRIEDSTHGFIGNGTSIGVSLDLINADDMHINGVVTGSVSIDANSDRVRIGELLYNLSGADTYTDNAPNTIYEGQIRNAANAFSSATGTSLFSSSANLLRNGGAEFWSGTNLPDWGTSGAQHIKTGVGQVDSTKLFGSYAAKMPSGVEYSLTSMREPELTEALGKPITISFWIYIPSGQAVSPVLRPEVWFNGGLQSYAMTQYAGTGMWKRFIYTTNVPSATTGVQLAIKNIAAGFGGTYYVDGVSMTHGKAGHPTEAPRNPEQFELKLIGSTSQNIMSIIAPPTLASFLQFIMPGTYGNPGELMMTDGFGNLSWTKRATYNPGSNVDTIATWTAEGNLSATAPWYKFGNDMVFNQGNILFDKAGQFVTLRPHPSTTTYSFTLPQAPPPATRQLTMSSGGQLGFADPASDLVLISTAGGPQSTTITVPAAGELTRKIIGKSSSDSNTLTVNISGGTINGSTSYALTTPFKTVEFACTGNGGGLCVALGQ